MSEALATYAGGPCSGYSIHEIVAYLDRQGELVPLDSLARNFRTYNNLAAYLQAGSFIGYLREGYGLPRVRALWEQGFEQLETILGKAPVALDVEWRNHLRVSYPDPKVEWAHSEGEGLSIDRSTAWPSKHMRPICPTPVSTPEPMPP